LQPIPIKTNIGIDNVLLCILENWYQTVDSGMMCP